MSISIFFKILLNLIATLILFKILFFIFWQKYIIIPMGKKKQIQKKTSKQITIAYRIYHKIKYRKYVLQFPRLRQSEVVQKINKQWDAMSQGDKLKFKQHYISNYDKSSSQNSQHQQPLQIVQKKKKIQTKVRIFTQKPQNQQQQFRNIRSWEKDQQQWGIKQKGGFNQQQISSSSSGYSIQIQEKDLQYHKFVKYYHQRLQKQHPTWKQDQYMQIINLFWKKKKEKKRTRTVKTHKLEVPKAFQFWQNKSQPLYLSQVQRIWVAMSRKAKNFWSGKSNTQTTLKVKNCIPKDKKKTQINKTSPKDLLKSLREQE